MSDIVFSDVCNHHFVIRIYNQIQSDNLIKQKKKWMEDYSYAKGLSIFLTSKTSFLKHALAPLVYATSSLIPGGHMVDDHSLLIKPDQPIIVFSHGIAGSRFMYSQFAIECCKRGLMVVAVEHMDGSAIAAKDEKGQILHYQHPPDDEESIKTFRRTQLIKRSQELKNVLEYVSEKWPNRDMYLAGHSFGGITAFHTSVNQSVKKLGVKKVLLVDPWWYALEESDLGSKSDSIYYCATTEKFHWPEQDNVSEKILNSGKYYTILL